MARQPLQRIDEQQVRPTIALDNTMVQASEGIDATGASSFDFTDGLMKALPQFFKAASAFQEQENKDLAEIGERMNAELAADPTLSLDKLVAKYTKSDSTPGRLRKQLNRWVQGGKINASANRFWARSIEEGQAKRSRSKFGALLMSELPDIVQAQKAVAHLGETAMMEAGEQYVAKMIEDHPELYDQMGEYGVATVTSSLIEEGNKLTAMGLSVATEELNNERVSEEISGLGSSLVGDFETASTQNAPVDSSDLVKGYGKSVGQSFSDLQDVALPDALRENIVNDTTTRMFQLARMANLTPDEAVEAIDSLISEIETARETTGNGPGSGPHVLPATGKHIRELHRQAMYAKGEVARRENSSTSDRFDGRTAVGLEIRKYGWANKHTSKWTDDERESFRDWEENLLKSGVSAEYFNGAMTAVKENNALFQGVEVDGEPTYLDQALIESAANPENIYSDRIPAPLLGSMEEIVAWATRGNPHREVVEARLTQIFNLRASTQAAVRTQQAKMPNIIEFALQSGIPGALSQQDLDAAAVKTYSDEYVRKFAKEPHLEKKFAELDLQVLEGTLPPEQALLLKSEYVRETFDRDPNNPVTQQKLIDANAERDQVTVDIERAATDPTEWLSLEAMPSNPLLEGDISFHDKFTQGVAEVMMVAGVNATPEEIVAGLKGLTEFDRTTKTYIPRRALRGVEVGDERLTKILKQRERQSNLYVQGYVFKHLNESKSILDEDLGTLGADFFEGLAKSYFRDSKTSVGLLPKDKAVELGRDIFETFVDGEGAQLVYQISSDPNSVTVGFDRLPLGALNAGQGDVTPDEIRKWSGDPNLTPQQAEILWGSNADRRGSVVAPNSSQYAIRDPRSGTSRMSADMDKLVENNPIRKYHWESAKRLWKLRRQEDYNPQILDHRLGILPIYIHVIDQSKQRDFE